MIRLKAPEGYKLRDTRTNREYTEVEIPDRDRGRFELVPDQTEPTVTEEVN